MTLDRSDILDAALDLIDEGGLEAFSMRTLGTRLGVSQMAAYRHFEDKAAILDALADRLLLETRPEDPDDIRDPDAVILDYCMRTREVFLSHPGLVPVVAARPLMQSRRAEDLVRLNRVFTAAGFPEWFIVEAVFTLMAVTLGLIMYEQQRTAFDRSQGDRYASMRASLFEALSSRDDIPPASRDLLRELGDGTWGERIFDRVVRETYEALRVRGGIT